MGTVNGSPVTSIARSPTLLSRSTPEPTSGRVSPTPPVVLPCGGIGSLFKGVASLLVRCRLSGLVFLCSPSAASLAAVAGEGVDMSAKLRFFLSGRPALGGGMLDTAGAAWADGAACAEGARLIKSEDPCESSRGCRAGGIAGAADGKGKEEDATVGAMDGVARIIGS